MKTDMEIAELLAPVTKKQMMAAIAAINEYGFDFSAPWDCDQDDREYEMFCGLRAAIEAAQTSVKP